MSKSILALFLFILIPPQIKSQICFRDSVNCIRIKENSFYDTVYFGTAVDLKNINDVFRKKNWLRIYTRLKKNRKDWSIKELESEFIKKYGTEEFSRVFDSISKLEPSNPDPLQLDVELIFHQKNCDLYRKSDSLNVVRTPKKKKRYLLLYTIRGESFFKYKIRRRKMRSLRMLAAYDRLIKDKRQKNIR
jgi:hypothetical protein